MVTEDRHVHLLADQLDAIWKGGDHVEAMRKQIMAVKKKFAKEG